MTVEFATPGRITMDAKELHDLVAPLWERVPETRPADVNGNTLGLDPEHPVCFAWLHECEEKCCRHGAVGRIGFQEAAALIRVAIEDWLIRHGEYLAFELRPDLQVGTDDGSFGATDLIRALVEVAHARADLMGLPKGEVRS